MSAATVGRSRPVGVRPGPMVLVAALFREVRPFLRLVRARPVRDLGLPAWEFALGAVQGVVALTGMGQAVDSGATARVLARCRPGILVSLGFGGALTPEVPPGGLVLGESCWRYHPDTRQLVAVELPAPPRPLPELVCSLAAVGLAAFSGALVTTPRLIHKGREGEPLRRLPHPVVDLETAALAQVAGTQGLPFLGLRAVTDGAREEIPDFLAGVGGGMSIGPGAALRWVVSHPPRLGILFHLWRRSRQAAGNLARALLILLPLLGGAGEQFENQPAKEG